MRASDDRKNIFEHRTQEAFPGKENFVQKVIFGTKSVSHWASSEFQDVLKVRKK